MWYDTKNASKEDRAMPKNTGNMTDHELLEELVMQGRRAERMSRIKICLVAVLLLLVAILALVYIPKIMAPIRQLNESMIEIRGTMEKAQTILDQFDGETVDKFKQTMESLSETSQQARVLLQKLKDSGLDSFASNIESLNEALDGLLKYFRR
ncbi:MAG TPA: hypothetical protein DCM61_00015 [Clostridiales bacterium]|nr:hypothetical protein [Clostridiales bacterium]